MLEALLAGKQSKTVEVFGWIITSVLLLLPNSLYHTHIVMFVCLLLITDGWHIDLEERFYRDNHGIPRRTRVLYFYLLVTVTQTQSETFCEGIKLKNMFRKSGNDRFWLWAGQTSYCTVMFGCLIFVFICLISLSDGLVVVGVHSAKFPNEKVSVFIVLHLFFFSWPVCLWVLSAFL